MQDCCYETYHSVLCFLLKGQIQDFLEPGSVNPQTALVLVNAIYFKGIWKTPFKEEDTQEVPFNVTEVGGTDTLSGQLCICCIYSSVVIGWVIYLGASLSYLQQLCLTGHISRQEAKMETNLFLKGSMTEDRVQSLQRPCTFV